MKRILVILLLIGSNISFAQDRLTPEALWELGRVSAIGILKDQKNVVYKVTRYDAEANASWSKEYMIPIGGGEATEIVGGANLVVDRHISPQGTHRIDVKSVKINKVYGKDYYPGLDKSEAM